MQMVKSGLIVASCTIIVRTFGYIRDICMAIYLGINADAFAVAFRLPNTFRTLFAEGAFSSAFVPMFSSKLADDHQRAVKFASQVFTLLTLVMAILTVVMLLFMEQIIAVLAPGFTSMPEKAHITVTLSYFTMPYLFFIALASLYSGALNSHGKFAVAAALPVVLNIGMILAIKFLTPFSASPSYALAYGVLISGVLQFLIVVYAAHRASLEIKFTKIIITDDMRKMFSNILPTVIGSGMLQLNLAISTIVSSYIEGAASILYYAERLSQFPLAIIGTALATVLLPTLSRQLKDKKFEDANHTQNKALEVALFFTLPCAFALCMISTTLVGFLFERGEFTENDTYKVAQALIALALGLPAFVMIKIFTPRFFAEYDTKTPVRISLFCMASNIVLSIILTRYFSYLGIAMAISISSWMSVFLLYYFQRKRKMFHIDSHFIVRTTKIFIACAFMILSVMLFEDLVLEKMNHGHISLIVLLEVVIGMIVYFTIGYLLKILDFSFATKPKPEDIDTIDE